MEDKKFNFNLGNRGLTASESKVVDRAKSKLRESLSRHARDGRIVEASAVFKATATATATASVTRARGSDVVSGKSNPANPSKGTTVASGSSKRQGSDEAQGPKWRTSKVAPSARRY